MLIAWLTRLLEARRAKADSEFILKRDGCICYCHECKAVLNGLGSWIDGDRCEFRCSCGFVSIFGFFAPVPILLSCLPDDRFPPKDVIPIIPIGPAVDHSGSTNGLL
jgi:hypothetical protein